MKSSQKVNAMIVIFSGYNPIIKHQFNLAFWLFYINICLFYIHYIQIIINHNLKNKIIHHKILNGKTDSSKDVKSEINT